MRTEIGYHPEAEKGERHQLISKEKLQAAAQKLKKTALPLGLYIALVFGGQEAEAFAQTKAKTKEAKGKDRGSVVKKEKTETPENIEALAKGEVERKFIEAFKIKDRAELEQMRTLISDIGVDHVHRILNRGVIGLEEGATSEKPVVYSEFDKHPKAGGRLNRLLETAVPKEVLRLGVRVLYINELTPMPQAYGSAVSGTPEKPVYEAGHFSQLTLEATINKTPETLSNLEIIELMAHEFGHGASAVASSVVGTEASFSRRDRYLLLVDLVKRVRAENRFKSTYVENIKAVTEQETLQKKVEEYLAEIIAAAVMGKPLAEEDMAIITKRLGNIDFKANKEEFTAVMEAWEKVDAEARDSTIFQTGEIENQRRLAREIEKIRRTAFGVDKK